VGEKPRYEYSPGPQYSSVASKGVFFHGLFNSEKAR